jgi:hypothetical protein
MTPPTEWFLQPERPREDAEQPERTDDADRASALLRLMREDDDG